VSKAAVLTETKEMPIETYIAIGALVVVFGGYAALLAWAEWYTRVE
jgi:hypothetical protein